MTDRKVVELAEDDVAEALVELESLEVVRIHVSCTDVAASSCDVAG